MAGEDVIVSVGLDSAPADAGLMRSSANFTKWSKETNTALAKAEGAVVKMEKSVAKLDKPIDQAAVSAAKLRAESEKLEKISSLLGPRLGGVVQIVSKLGKAAGSDVGGATLAIAGLAAGAGAALYALGSFGSMVVDTIVNVDDLADSLDTVTRERLAAQIKSLRDSRDALDEFGESWTEMKIAVAGAVDGPLADLVTILGKSVEGWALMGEALDRFVTDHPIAAGILGINNPLAETADLLRQVERNANAAGDALNREIDAAADAAARDEQARRDARDRIAPPKATPAAHGTASNREDPMDRMLSGLTGSAATGAAALLGDAFHVSFDSIRGDATNTYDLLAAGLDAQHDLDKQYADEKAKIDKQIADAAIEQIEREQAARKESLEKGIAAASQFSAGLIGIGMQLTDAQVANTKEGTEAHRQALRNQITMQETAAVANAALGITNIWSQWAAQPIVAAALTLVEGAATGLAIGQLEAQKSKLHTGGLAPDEQYGMPPPITRNGERSTVLTAEGARDPQGLADLNAGRTGEREPVIYLLDPAGQRRARRHAKPSPDLGLAMARGRR